MTVATEAPFLRIVAVQPASGRSIASKPNLSVEGVGGFVNVISCQTRPFRMATPAAAPTSIVTDPCALWVGVFHVACAVLVMRVPSANPFAMFTRKRSTVVAPAARLPRVAE